jgi:PhzF family phenazine biosynthesis protein
MQQSILQVDAFTDKPFAGNPAAVCIMDVPADTTWMQNVAMEMNLSETAFVWPLRSDLLSLRWFTPTVEVDLCGHATLAAAHVLWEEGVLRADQFARFETRSGILTARREGAWMELDFPATPASKIPTPPDLIDALGIDLSPSDIETGRSRFDLLIDLEIDETQLVALAPDMARLARLPVRGVIVTTSSTSDSRFDFVSRFFAPRAGVNEDPVTGSAHCALAPWWSGRLHKREMLAYQASRRGGIVRVKLQDDRVMLGGQAITVMRAQLIA